MVILITDQLMTTKYDDECTRLDQPGRNQWESYETSSTDPLPTNPFELIITILIH